MKGSVLTTKTWFLLIGAALLITAGILNFGQRARNETPPWDGVEWVDTADGIIAKSIEKGSAADRAWLLPGDRLIGIALDPRARADQVVNARDVQFYLDQARIGGQLHYKMQRPSYPEETRNYWADLDNLGSVHKWTPRVIYLNVIGLGVPADWFLCSVQARCARAVRPPFRDAVSHCVCLPLLHADSELSRPGFGDRVSEEFRLHTVCADVPALLHAVPDEAATVFETALARDRCFTFRHCRCC